MKGGSPVATTLRCVGGSAHFISFFGAISGRKCGCNANTILACFGLKLQTADILHIHILMTFRIRYFTPIYPQIMTFAVQILHSTLAALRLLSCSDSKYGQLCLAARGWNESLCSHGCTIHPSTSHPSDSSVAHKGTPSGIACLVMDVAAVPLLVPSQSHPTFSSGTDGCRGSSQCCCCPT